MNENPSPEQKEKEMEVHHHGHVHEKKKWKEYIFQFIMLLLAVFLGTFAETKREEWVEGNKEHEYIASMVEDIQKDTVEMNNRHAFILTQIEKMDSIQILLRHDLKNNKDEIFKCYELSWYLFWYATAVFNERTFSQLIGSGNMRLIRKKGAADKIMEYYNAIKRIDQQKQQYLTYINLTLGAVYKVYDVSILRRELNPSDSRLYWASIDVDKIRFRTTDPDALLDLGGVIENTKFVIDNYMEQLEMIDQNANDLLVFLKENYHIKE